jgi:hypothetical protein
MSLPSQKLHTHNFDIFAILALEVVYGKFHKNQLYCSDVTDTAVSWACFVKHFATLFCVSVVLLIHSETDLIYVMDQYIWLMLNFPGARSK